TKADYSIDGDYSRKDAEQTIEEVKRIKNKIKETSKNYFRHENE
ncbi:hypothetical protein MNBD_NITROSPINAE04-2361, partial [hydrothermal vent metagenome]